MTLFPASALTPRNLGRLVIGWSGGFPLLLLLSIPTGEWLIAAHYYGLPVVFFGHFLFALGGFALFFEKVFVGRVLSGAATMCGLAGAVAALSIIHMVVVPGHGEGLAMLVRTVSYLIHAAYLLGNVWIAVAIFRIQRPASAA